MSTATISALLIIACASGVSEASSKVALEKDFDDKIVKQSSETAVDQDVSSHKLTTHERSANAHIAKVDSPKSAPSVMAAAMARRLVHNDLLMVNSRIAKRRTRNFLQEEEHLQSGTWLTLLILVLLFLAIILLLYLVAREPDDTDDYYTKTKTPIVPGRPVDVSFGEKPVENNNFVDKMGYSQARQSPFAPQVRPGAQSPPAQHLLGRGSGGVPSQGLGSGSQVPQQPPPEAAQSPLQSTLNAIGLGNSFLSPQSASRAAWSTTPGVPPPLRTNQVPPQVPKTYRVAVDSLRKLYARAPIHITGGDFDYPLFHARLGNGAEGSRLEVAAEPSWRSLIATLGRLDYPARLSPDASLHGPDREYYGPFQRYGNGFSVGHWSKGGTQVFTLAPRKGWTGGFYVEVKCGSTDIASAQSIDNGSRYQIDIQPGIDNVLVITSILGAFIASQPMIDEAGTRV